MKVVEGSDGQQETIEMLKTSQTKMFAALKYHSTDYLYESMARQKFSIWKLSLCFPPCLYQDEKYHLNGLFADDKYRKPWTRICSTQNMIAISVLDQWKKSLPVEDFLEKKPISSVEFHTSNDLIEVIPSSNPYSQTNTEECFLLMKNGFKEDTTQDKYLKIYYAAEFKGPRQEFGKPNNSRSDYVKIPSYLQLKEVLSLAPVTVDDEDVCKQVSREDLKAEITYKTEISKYCAIPQEVCSSISTSMLEFCESDPSREFLESLVWQSEKYRDNMSSLLLVEHPAVNLAHQHPSLTELQKELPVEVEAPVLGSLEEGWWLHRSLNPAAVEILEQLNMDGNNANSLLHTEVETFTPFTSYQLERWLEEKNSMTNQELLSAERHHSEKVINPDLSQKIARQYFAMGTATSAKIHSTNTSVEELSGGSIRKIKTEEAICFLNQEKKIPKPSELDSCKDVSSKLENSSCSGKPASLALASRWANDDSDLNNFIMMRYKHTVTQREENYYVDRSEKVAQPEEQHMRAHKEEDSFCETVKTEEKTQESEDSITVNVQPSESQCQAYHLLEGAAIPVLKDLTHLGVLPSVTWSFDSVKFDHTRFFLKQQEKVICDNFKQGKIDEKEIMLFRHAALVHLLVTIRDLLLTCGLDTALGYLSKAKDIYKNILESCLNNIWRQLKVVQYSSQKKHETHPKITALQCEMLNWMKSCGEKHSVKILIITRMDSEREKSVFIHPLSRIEGTSHSNSEALIPPLNYHKGFLKSDLASCMQKKACSSEVVTRRKSNFFAVSKDYEDFAHPEVKNSLHVQRQPLRMHDSSGHSSNDTEKEDFFAAFSDCIPQKSSRSFLEEFRDKAFKNPEIQIDQPLWNDSSSTGLHNSFAHDSFLSDFFDDTDELQNLSFNQIGGASKGKRKQRPPFLSRKEKVKKDVGFPEVKEFKKRRLTYERVPGRRDGQTRLKFF
ncbi:hypothetical protein DUI87_28827 [Hirundo rustica rustica]|uniref:Uncharacterized protein n=1 Tax=Hirundo rustica rustica TaxID=333673 RepID=A0A3M0J197_HIRRU|nr:hypothetical protein DUI87_28827 [Hirundo rustica rustica]